MSIDTSSVYVLTDTPAAYGDALNHGDSVPIFTKDIGTLIDKLKNVSMAGLVLELPKVMKASRTERDRLFSYATSFPVLRTKPNPSHGFVAYLDSKDCFFKNLEAAIGKRCRSHERVQVKLDCTYSSEADPIMADAVEGKILDISPGGCFINTRNVMEKESFVHLHIPALNNSRPIFSSIRWAKTDDTDGAMPGLGVMFIDLSDEQLEDIQALQLTAQVR